LNNRGGAAAGLFSADACRRPASYYQMGLRRGSSPSARRIPIRAGDTRPTRRGSCWPRCLRRARRTYAGADSVMTRFVNLTGNALSAEVASPPAPGGSSGIRTLGPISNVTSACRLWVPRCAPEKAPPVSAETDSPLPVLFENRRRSPISRPRSTITLPKKSTAARAAPVNTTRTLLKSVEMFRMETRWSLSPERGLQKRYRLC